MLARIALLVIFLCATPAAAQTWARLSASGDVPSGRTTPAVAALASAVYLWSGVRDDFATFQNTYFDDLYRYDVAANHWTRLFPAGVRPTPRTFAASAAHPGRNLMVVFGGTVFDETFETFEVFNDLWVYSPAANAWTEIVATNPGPDARAGATMWIVDDRMYLFGGITQFFEFRNDLWFYDFATNAWSELIPNGAAGSPDGRHLAAAGTTATHRTLTIYGGENIDFSTFSFQILPDTWQLDLETLVWTNVTPAAPDDISPHRNYGASEIIGQQLYLYGGDIPGGSSGCGAPFPQNVTDELWSFHTVQRRWRKLTPGGDLPPALKRTRAAVVGERMLMFSGWDFQCDEGVGPGQVFNTDVFAFDNDASP